MIVVAAPDKFRGSAAALDVAAAIAAEVEGAGSRCRQVPLADGGEGTLEALGGGNRRSTVSGPLGPPVVAAWRLAGRFAVIESAQACGLDLAGGAAHNDPLNATTRGVGELVSIAVGAGAERVLIGVGGSATTDGGVGAVSALAGTDLSRVELRACCDVTTRFTDAARIFAPQKGATDRQVLVLSARLQEARRRYLVQFGVDVDGVAGSGAGGGLAGGLCAVGARLVPGFAAVADEVGLDRALAGADLVVTGEGRVDATSSAGKVVGGVVGRAAAADVPVLVLAGSVGPHTLPPATTVVDLSARYGRNRSWRDPLGCVRAAMREVLR